MKILITGAAGFIGSNLCEHFLTQKHQIIGLDNFATGSKANLKSFLKHPNFKFFEGDILDFKLCLELTKKVDYVLHQAALGSVPRSIKNPIDTNKVNINGFLNILESSRINKIKRLIYAASSSTYGDSKEIPKKEETIGNPLSPYAVTKYVNELYSNVYNSIYGLNTIGLRYFNVYGKNQDPNGPYAAVIPKFISDFKNKKSPIINGDGSYSRDFTYIDNVIQMNYLALTTENKKALNQVFNTACGEKVKIIEMAEVIKKEMTKYDNSIRNIDIKFGPKRVGDIPHSKASIKKASELLNYTPSYFFEAGIKETIKWYINQ